jgi:ABC-type sugar transport system ATPase subunit
MLELKNLSLRFKEFALEDVNLNIHEGEYYVILGLSGAGKSLLLECIAGMQTPQQGSIILEGVDITKEKIQNRKVGYVFQDHAVFPHMSVFNNIAYSIKKEFSKDIVKQKVLEAAELVSIGHLLDRQPGTLSGGESQRVALARTLIRNPKCLLLDEPFSSLDVQLRDDLRSLLRKLNRMGRTIVHVTHDYEEAISLAQKVAIFQNGRLIQQGNPFEVFANPVSEFVARFRGIRNFFKSKMIQANRALINDQIEVEIRSQKVVGDGFIMMNSQDIFICKDQPNQNESNVFKGKIIDVVPNFKGNEISIESSINLTSFINHQSFKDLKLKIGDEVWAYFKAESVKFLLIT